ncbi:MAG: hypothetical protein WC759_01835 [Candidatus Micrarchaeia archaeon]|jgi:hypothetical protein
MDSRTYAVILLVLAVAIGYSVFSSKHEPTKDEALKFVQEDLAAKYPGADYEILSANKNGSSWSITARATFDAGTACPSRLHAYYTYPQFGYVVRDDWITRNCQVCAGLPPEKCVLFFEEEAVIASHTREGTQEVSIYLRTHPDAAPNARFYAEEGYPVGNPAYYDVWLVSWSSKADGSHINVLLTKQPGNVLQVWGASG